MQSEILLESRSARLQLCKEENTSILERVGQLVTLPETVYATTKQVAQFYQVSESAIKMVVSRNPDELVACGYKLLHKKRLSSVTICD